MTAKKTRKQVAVTPTGKAIVHDENGRFAKGTGGFGRRKGSRDRFTTAVLNAFLADFDAHGAAAIEQLREESVKDYLRIAAALANKGALDERNDKQTLTDEEIRKKAAELVKRMQVGVIEGVAQELDAQDAQK